MIQRHFTISVFFSVIAFLILLFLPILTYPNATCPRSANAQDNPCLAQDATISALQIALIQSTLDGLNYQATIHALEGNASIAGGLSQNLPQTSVSAIELPYFETFDDNTRDWQIFTGDDGGIRISRGALTLTTDDQHVASIPIPGLGGQEYYLEMDVIPVDFEGYVGFRVGNFTDTYQIILIGYDGSNRNWLRVFDCSVLDKNCEELEAQNNTFNSLYNDLFIWEPERPFQVAFELKADVYTLYLNDVQVETLPSVGNEIALVAWGDSTRQRDVMIDNLTVRAAR